MKRPVLPASLLLLASGCIGLPYDEQPESVGSRTLEPWGKGGTTSLLYARDGSPVPDQPGGSVTTADGTTRELGSNDGSRPYLLELYQSAVDQKEALELEVTALQRELDLAHQERARQENERSVLQASLQEKDAQLTAREQENLELAARLATAQIRRLEAEKILLEATLEWNRVRMELDTGAEEGSESAGLGEDLPDHGGEQD